MSTYRYYNKLCFHLNNLYTFEMKHYENSNISDVS